MFYLKCSTQYIGSTCSTELKVRFRNHKSAMITKKRTCEVAVHFNREPHQLSDFSFTGIEQVHNTSDMNSNDKLLTREAYWSAQLCILQPYCLNASLGPNTESNMANFLYSPDLTYFYIFLMF